MRTYIAMNKELHLLEYSVRTTINNRSSAHFQFTNTWQSERVDVDNINKQVSDSDIVIGIYPCHDFFSMTALITARSLNKPIILVLPNPNNFPEGEEFFDFLNLQPWVVRDNFLNLKHYVVRDNFSPKAESPFLSERGYKAESLEDICLLLSSYYIRFNTL